MTAYVTRIASNVKKGVCAELGKRTLIVGPNGAGKSSVVNSIELALGGYSSDVMGKASLKKPSDLMVLSADGKTLEVEAYLSDGTKATFYTEKTQTGAKRPKRTGPSAVVFPFSEVTAHLTASAAKARTWFLQKIALEVSSKDVTACFPETAREAYSQRAEQCKTVNPHFTEVDALIYTMEAEAKKGRDSRAEVKAITSLLDEMQDSMPSWPPTESEIAALKIKEQEAMTAYSSEMRKSRGSTPQQVQESWERASRKVAELSQLESIYGVAVSHFSEIQGRESDFNTHDAFYADIRRQLIPVVELHARIEATECLVCGSFVAPEVDDATLPYLSSLEALRTANQSFDAFESAKGRVEEIQKNLVSSREQAQLSIEEWKHLTSILTVEDPGKIRASAAEHHKAMQKRMDAQAHLSKWEELSRLRDRVEEQQENEKKAKKLAKECQNVIRTLLQSTISDFQKTVQVYLPSTDVFGLEVDTKTDTCRFGLRRGEVIVSALSGAEWARVITAIACATTPESQMAVFVPEERAFDPQTLGTVMRALGKAPGQVILTSTVSPDSAPEDWTILDLS